MNMEI